jgi:hypothetical protein
MVKNLIDAWDCISLDIIESVWAIYRWDWAPYDSEDPEGQLVDGEYRPEVRREDLEDLIKPFATSFTSIHFYTFHFSQIHDAFSFSFSYKVSHVKCSTGESHD